ncbi:hypothetical protein Zmor_016327 [Zophobas morio]|uniref:Cyclic nucleotide-binding domain-containing protein n=1 Tax=Zophobas morio TaxID=2755281 RepID=A0AA38HH50_9CUCU|nr:hypothetical protein Zmor_016327 [Zophobas morio]
MSCQCTGREHQHIRLSVLFTIRRVVCLLRSSTRRNAFDYTQRFGEISLIEHTNRTADVVAFEDCLFLFLSPENFNKFIQVQERHIQGSCRAFDSLISKRTTSSLKVLLVTIGVEPFWLHVFLL